MTDELDSRVPLVGGELFAVDTDVYGDMRAVDMSYSGDARCFDTREFVYVQEK